MGQPNGDLVVDHAFFKLDKSVQGMGKAKAYLAESFSFYKKLASNV